MKRVNQYWISHVHCRLLSLYAIIKLSPRLVSSMACGETYDINSNGKITRRSNEFCDILGVEAEKKGDASFSCSDCVLGSWKAQLESPFGYDDSLASDFSSQTSSCHATGFTFTTPTAYALNTTATPAPTPICQRTYTVLATDTCASIAQANKVATFGVVSLNNLGTGCEALVEGKTLCLPETCTLRKITRDDDCGQVVKDANTTIPRLIAWNPMLNPECSNFLDYIGYYICIS